MEESKPQVKINIRAAARVFAYILFWSWNAIFLAFMLLGFAPALLPELVTAVRTGLIPMQFLALAVILVIIPLVGVILGFTVLRQSPGRLLAFGYGVEGPLMLILAIRFFAVRETTAIMALLLAIAALGLAAFLWQILDRRIEEHRPLVRVVHLIGLTFLLAIGLYAGVWVAFYAVSLPIVIWRGVIDTLSQMTWEGLLSSGTQGVSWVLFSLLGLLLAAYTATLFVAMPIAVPYLYVRAWWQGIRRFASGSSRLGAAGLSALVLAVCIVAFALALPQPQHKAFAMLENPPATTTEARALLGQQEAIRAGLLNAYLAPARYISAVGEVYHVSDLFVEAFGLTAGQARPIQQAYEVVARPVLYEPVEQLKPAVGASRWDNQAFQREPARAAELYEDFFDVPIIDAERGALVDAARSTWLPDQARSAWQAIDDREIHLVRQEIAVAEHGDWAEVELVEVYQNQTSQRQEVVYYFSLPESAVITGVWLGNSADRDERFEYRVSPRGAAQEMYQSEVRYNMDPALVEQLGPRQYRLRVFPIEPQRVQWNDPSTAPDIEDAPEMHMWLTYRVLASGDAWPLPRLADKRNVYWDDASKRLVNGQPMQVDGEKWLPASAPVTDAASAAPVAHRVDFAGDQTVLALPVSDGDLPALPGDYRLAVVLDRSRSMAAHEADVKAALAQLEELAGEDVDVYLSASDYRGEEPSRVKLSQVASDDILYYGGQNAAELLVQFDELQAGEDYDAVLVLTDGTGYDVADDETEVPLPDAPVWMVHLGGDFPLGYDDATLQAIQASGGGVAGSVEEALTRQAVAAAAWQAGDGAAPYDVVDGYIWQVVAAQDAGASATSGDAGFAALAARRLILSEMIRSRGKLDDPATLDALHAIAVENSVVTPYSSMIVLVTDEQQQRLDSLEKGDDRFLREHEDVGETPSNLGVTAVPEPEEWLLIGLALAMLLWVTRKKWPALLRRPVV